MSNAFGVNAYVRPKPQGARLRRAPWAVACNAFGVTSLQDHGTPGDRQVREAVRIWANQPLHAPAWDRPLLLLTAAQTHSGGALEHNLANRGYAHGCSRPEQDSGTRPEPHNSLGSHKAAPPMSGNRVSRLSIIRRLSRKQTAGESGSCERSCGCRVRSRQVAFSWQTLT